MEDKKDKKDKSVRDVNRERFEQEVARELGIDLSAADYRAKGSRPPQESDTAPEGDDTPS